jgi:hypothetical protein
MTHLLRALSQVPQEPFLNLDAIWQHQQPIQATFGAVLIGFALLKDFDIGTHQNGVSPPREVDHFQIVCILL